MEITKTLTQQEIELQMIRATAFHDGYQQAMKYVSDLLKEPTKDGTGIPADNGNTTVPS